MAEQIYLNFAPEPMIPAVIKKKRCRHEPWLVAVSAIEQSANRHSGGESARYLLIG